MGKNYTIYINQDRFAAEANKSGLINHLLEAHYGGGGFSEVTVKRPLDIRTLPPDAKVQVPEIEPTFAVVVKDTGVIIGKKMSRLGAENFLQKSNIDGDMIMVQE